MTFREKLRMEHPEVSANEIHIALTKGCPSRWGYEDLDDSPCRPGNVVTPELCKKCWDREIPETEKTEEKGLFIGDERAEHPDTDLPSIKDSGDRTEFATGAVRDMREGKGRCDLMPLDVVHDLFTTVHIGDWVLFDLAMFQQYGTTEWLYNALVTFAKKRYNDCIPEMLLDVAKHFEEGAKKYGENNWQKGIPTWCYIDSAVRHYLKWLRGDKDEPHDRAFVWNLLCCIWTIEHEAELKEEK